MGYSGRPWEKRKWRNGIIRPSKAGLILISIMGLMFTGLGIGAAVTAKNALSWPPNKDNFVLLFICIGVLLLILAAVMAARQWKFHGAMFRLETMPGVIGGMLKGVLVFPDVPGCDGLLDIRLVNEEQVTSGSGKHKHTTTYVLYEHSETVNIADYSRSNYTPAGLGPIEIPLEFAIPYDTKDETDSYSRHKYRWKLTAKADVQGLNIDFEFDVPVFRTEQSRKEITIEEMETTAVQEDLFAIKQGSHPLKEIAVIFQDGHEHYLSKSKGYILFVFGAVLFAIGSGFIGYGIVNARNSEDAGIGMVFAIASASIPGFFGFCILFVGGLISLAGLLNMGRSDVFVAEGAVHYCRRLACFNFRKRIDRDLITDITVEKCGSVNGRNLHAVHVSHTDLNQVSAIERVFLSKIPNSKKSNIKLEVARDINDKAEALWLANRLKERLNMDTDCD